MSSGRLRRYHGDLRSRYPELRDVLTVIHVQELEVVLDELRYMFDRFSVAGFVLMRAVHSPDTYEIAVCEERNRRGEVLEKAGVLGEDALVQRIIFSPTTREALMIVREDEMRRVLHVILEDFLNAHALLQKFFSATWTIEFSESPRESWVVRYDTSQRHGPALRG